MLIEFRVTNFRSFKETQVFSMVAASFREHLKTNTFDPKIKGFEERLLRSTAIYGGNAAGKTNLLRALHFMKMFIINPPSPTSGLQYNNTFKFASSARNAPSEFEVTFIHNDIRYEYGFAISSKRVEKEWLIEFVNARGRVMYEREYDKKSEKFEWKFGTHFKGQRSVWSEATRPDALFLSTAVQLNSKLLSPVFEWFQKRLIVVVGETKLNAGLTLGLLDKPEGKEEVLSFMRMADHMVTGIDVKREPIPPGAVYLQSLPMIEQKPGQSTPNIVRVTLSHSSDNKNHSEIDLNDVSSGTQVFFKTAGPWLNVFKKGEVLLFDELEASLHPLLVMFLIKKFHSEKTNPKNAQLVFTTHNPILLDQEIFRRDQIWFVEKDRVGSSKVYPLTDFKPRNDEVLARWYMRGRYGGIPLLEGFMEDSEQ